MPIADINSIFAKCSPAASTTIESCGALTLCNISPTTIDQYNSIFSDPQGRYRFLQGLFTAEFVGRSCVIQQNGMYDWLQATRKNWGTRRLGISPLRKDVIEVQPFVRMERKGPINNYYWALSSGASGGTSPSGATVDFNGLVASQTGIPNDVRWFPAGMSVYISGKTGGGSKTETAYQIVEAQIQGNFIKIWANSQNAASSLPGFKLTLPTTGVLRRGINNVNDYERYCAQIPGLNTKQMTPFWIQTTRWDLCEDELVTKYLQALRDGNEYFKEFGDVESVEFNRQVVTDFQHRQAEAFFFQKPLPNQTMTGWGNLQEIQVYSDSLMGNYIYNAFEGRCVGRRANATGIYEQLAECGRVKDLQGQTLNIPELQRALYSLMRRRKSNNIPATVIELYTDSYFAQQIGQGFLRYFDFKSEGLMRLNMDISKGNMGEQGPLGFWFRRFSLDWPNIELRIVSHEFFDDLVDAHTSVSPTLTSAGRVAWILDWTTNYQAIIDSNSVNNQSGDRKLLAAVSENHLCTMRVPTKSVRLNSLTFANIAECPAASLLLENIGEDVPEHQFRVAPYDDYYGDYPGN